MSFYSCQVLYRAFETLPYGERSERIREDKSIVPAQGETRKPGDCSLAHPALACLEDGEVPLDRLIFVEVEVAGW